MSPRHARWLGALALALAPQLALGQGVGILQGRITDAASGQPIPSAQLRVDGTTIGTESKETGEYTLGVPPGTHTIIVRRIGYAEQRQPVTIAAGTTQTLDFALKAVAVTLGTVVTTGQASPVEKRAVGTSIATVDRSQIQNSGAETIDQALQGKVPGAQITNNSGNPGGGGISVRLRGTSSLISGSEPLYIIDGVIVDNSSDQLVNLGARSNVQNRLADLDPNDIDHIEVIRGAAAAALYGSRANNGVIQIFTKRGRAGKPTVTFRSEYTSEQLAHRLGMNMYPFDAAGNPVKRYDYQDYIFHTGGRTDNYLSVDGGDDKTRYYISGDWSNDNGIVINSSSSRKSARINLSQELYPSLRLDVGGNYTNTHDEFEPNGESTHGVITALVFTPTTFSYFPVNGAYPLSPLGGFANPLDVIYNWSAPQDVNRFVGDVQLHYDWRNRLTAQYILGYDGYSMQAGQFIPRGSVTDEPTGYATNIVRDSRIINNDASATLTWPSYGRFDFASSIGFNQTSQRIGTTSATGRDLLPTSELVGAAAVPFAGQSLYDLVTLGYYGQQTVNWRDRLYLTGALRFDASSTFGPKNRWQEYPKLSASYVIGDEPWFQQSIFGRAFSSLRLRAALGYAGNQPSIANAYSRYTVYDKAVNNDRVGVVNDPVLGNEDLKPEREREWEGGADMAFLGNRLSVEATYYNKLVTDLLLFEPLPPSTGYTGQYANVGAMTNKGVELGLHSINYHTERFSWETNLTYAQNANEVTRLVVAPFFRGYVNYVEQGQPVGVFYAETYLRDSVTHQIVFDSLGRPVRSRQKAVLGNPAPLWFGSLLNTFTIGKNLSFRVLFDGNYGNKILNLTRRIQDLEGSGSDAALELEGKLPKGYLAARLPIFEEYVEDGSYTKLRELSATYHFGPGVASHIGASGMDLSLIGRNLYTWTKYRGYDPEVNLFGQNTVERGNDFAAYPIPRTFGLSVRLTY